MADLALRTRLLARVAGRAALGHESIGDCQKAQQEFAATYSLEDMVEM